MWLTIKIGAFYGAPILAIVLALVWFVVLLRRARGKRISRGRAAALYPLALLLPFAAVGLIWLVGQLASYFAVPSGQYVWSGGQAWQFFLSLLPIAAYVGIPIAALTFAFWAALAFAHPR